jgi:multiple sugar transport system substrate-binding protein
MIRLGAVAAVAALVLTGCSAGGTSDDGADAEAETGPVELQYWYYGSTESTQPVIDLWNEQNPDIQVVGTNPGSGAEYQAKIIAANKAGNAPDVANLQFQDIPAFVSSGDVLDGTEYFEQYADRYASGPLASVTFDDSLYGLPTDVGPMQYYYRTDIFEQFGLEVPTTWEEFEATAKKLHDADPTKVLAHFSPQSPNTNWFVALATQAGSDWWSVDDGKWKVGIADEAGMKVADLWDGLIQYGAVLPLKERTPEWNAAMASGQIASMVGATWTANYIAGVAPETQGLWAVAPLPQWDPSDPVDTYYGGSSIMIPSGSKHPEQAAEFIAWFTSDPESLQLRASITPTFVTIEDPSSVPALSEPPSFMPNDPEFWNVAFDANEDAKAIGWGPNVPVAYAAYEDALASALESGGSFSDALQKVHDATLADLKSQGFPVAE